MIRLTVTFTVVNFCPFSGISVFVIVTTMSKFEQVISVSAFFVKLHSYEH